MATFRLDLTWQKPSDMCRQDCNHWLWAMQRPYCLRCARRSVRFPPKDIRATGRLSRGGVTLGRLLHQRDHVGHALRAIGAEVFAKLERRERLVDVHLSDLG